jgi:hypothetical protein
VRILQHFVAKEHALLRQVGPDPEPTAFGLGQEAEKTVGNLVAPEDRDCRETILLQELR